MATTPIYQFLARDPRTHAVIGELRPQDITSARWQRHQYQPGAWSLSIPRVLANASSEAAGTDLIALQNMVEVRRDGEREFVGYILGRELDETNTLWRLDGFDLLDWLNRRQVGSETAVAKSGVAETVLKAYVAENLGVDAATTRQMEHELAGLTFTVEGDSGRGGAVEYNAQRRMLAAVTADVCQQGDLVQTMVLTDSGLEYRVGNPVNATEGSAGLAFSVNLDNVMGIGWREDVRGLQNALTVAGEGTGESRLVTVVEDAGSIATNFRREGTFSTRAATTVDQLTAVGAAEIRRQVSASIAASAVPLQTSEHARYREHWDVGYDVTIALPAARVPAVDRRVVSATVELVDGVGERITMALGVEAPTSVLRKIERKFAQVEADRAV